MFRTLVEAFWICFRLACFSAALWHEMLVVETLRRWNDAGVWSPPAAPPPPKILLLNVFCSTSFCAHYLQWKLWTNQQTNDTAERPARRGEQTVSPFTHPPPAESASSLLRWNETVFFCLWPGCRVTKPDRYGWKGELDLQNSPQETLTQLWQKWSFWCHNTVVCYQETGAALFWSRAVRFQPLKLKSGGIS